MLRRPAAVMLKKEFIVLHTTNIGGFPFVCSDALLEGESPLLYSEQQMDEIGLIENIQDQTAY